MPPIVIIGTVYESSRFASMLATASLAFALAVYVIFDARLCTSVLPTLLNRSFSNKDDPSNLIGSTLSVCGALAFVKSETVPPELRILCCSSS